LRILSSSFPLTAHISDRSTGSGIQHFKRAIAKTGITFINSLEPSELPWHELLNI